MTGQGRAPGRAEAVTRDGAVIDIRLRLDGRDILMLGPAGQARELALVPGAFPPAPRQSSPPALPVLIGSGTGAALAEAVRRLESAFGPDFRLVVVDKEADILALTATRERFSRHPGIIWIDDADAESALARISRLQIEVGGPPLLPLLNPFYLRLDRAYYAAVHKACEASGKADFWSRARYVKFKGEPRILLLTSTYFLMGEIVAACERLGYEHRLLQVPEGESGKSEFIEALLSAVIEFKPDFALTVNHLGVDREGVLAELLEKLRLPLASWFVDNPHLILALYERLRSPWTALFTWDADNIASLAALGFEHVFYLPLGVDTRRFRPPAAGDEPPAGLPVAWDRRAAFVGNSMVHKIFARSQRTRLPKELLDGYRNVAGTFAESEERSVRAHIAAAHPALLPFFDGLASAELRLDYETMLTWEATRQYRLSCVRAILPFRPLIVGDDGWKSLLPEKGWQYRAELGYYAELPRFYPLCALNFNCTSQQMKGAVNQRVFDVPASGAFLLTDYREQMENLFEPGTEIVCYRSPEEATALAEKYLRDEKARARVIKAARARVLAEHDYGHRLRALAERMRTLYG